MQSKKTLFLFSALTLPVLVFVFLKFFGKNEFAVPLLHADSVPVNDCNLVYKTPYLLPDSVMEHIVASGKSGLYLLNFSDNESVIQRLGEELTGGKVKLVNPEKVFLQSKNIDVLRRCVLLTPDQNDLVLIDSVKQIRGYYNSGNLDEVDRLIMEAKIILKQY